jgi:hypothetical protein
MDGIDLGGLLSATLNHQISQFTIAFGIAAWIHSGRVKKEISNQMTQVIAAINNTALALRQDLQAQDKRITILEVGITNITSRVSTLAKEEGEIK